MNKKGIIVIIIIIVLVVIGYMAWGAKNAPAPADTDGSPVSTEEDGVNRDDFAVTDKDTTDATLLARLGSVSVSAGESGDRTALVKGMAQFTSENVKGMIVLGDVAVEKVVGDTKYVVTSLSVNSGGSGTFNYVVLFEDRDGNLTDKSYSLVGDRVKITGLRADEVSGGLIVSVSYMDHDKGEPLAAFPTVPRTKILVVDGGVFNSAKEINL
ncbi:MAG: hypothetical protein Q7R72_01630 [bacterium]|nr:hypothetical protein [bacterium]